MPIGLQTTSLQTLGLTATLPRNPNPPGNVNTVTLSSNLAAIVPDLMVTGPPNSVGSGAAILYKAGASPFVLTLSVPNAINTNASAISVPLLFTPGVKAVAIAAGNEHTMALRTDGSIVCWGRNVEGQTSTSGLSPITASATLPGAITATASLAAPVLPATTASNYTLTLSVANASIVPGMLVSGGAPGTIGSGAVVTAVSAVSPFPVTLSVPNTNTTALTGITLTFTSQPGSTTSTASLPAGPTNTMNLTADNPAISIGMSVAGAPGTVDSGATVTNVLHVSPFTVTLSVPNTNAAMVPSTSLVFYSPGPTPPNSIVTLAAANPAIVPGMYVTGPASTVGIGAMVLSKDASGKILTLSTRNAYAGTTTSAAQTLTFSTGIKATAIAAGGDTSYALKPDATVAAWGDNYNGQTNVPGGLTGVTAIAAGGDHAVALKNDGTVQAWGKIWNGSAYVNETVPTGLTGVTAIAAGAYHAVALSIIYNSTLSALTLSDGSLSPTFTPGTKFYTAAVANAITGVTVTPTVTDVTAMVTVNGVSVTSGTASAAIPLAVGNNTITVLVTAQNGTTTSTYTITVTRNSTVSTLSGLALSAGTLSPTFATATTSYTASVFNVISSVTVTPTVTDTTATITVNGTVVSSGAFSPAIPLSVGDNPITVLVTAQDGTTTSTYTVTLTRSPSSNSTLSGLALSSGSLSPLFASSTTSYTVSIANATTSVTVTPVTTNAYATVKINGVAVTTGTASATIPLSVGDNTISVVVTSQDGNMTSTYTVTVTRAPSVATLSGLTVSGGTLSPGFGSSTTAYNVGLPGVTASVTVTPTVADANATVKVNGTTVTSGAASAAIPLAAGINTLTVTVTAQDGVTYTTYVLTIDNSSYGVWKGSAFTNPADLNNLAVSGEMATPAQDGITNLIKYALAIDPMQFGTSRMPTVSLRDGYLTLTYRKNKQALDVAYAVQSSASLTSNGWGEATTILSQTDEGGYWLVTVQDTVPYAEQRRRFMRLQVTTFPYNITIDNTPYGVWKKSAFTYLSDRENQAISGELACPAHDDIINLMKYALALDPMTCGASGLPSISPQDGYLTLTYRKNKQATDVSYVAQATDSLTGNNWTPATALISQTDEGTYWLVTVRDTVPYAGYPYRFMRLLVSH